MFSWSMLVRRNRSATRWICSAALALVASTVLAHDTWLLPSRFSSASGRTVTVDLTSGMAFPQLEYAIKPERVKRAVILCPSGEQALPDPKRKEKALRFAARCSDRGAAQIIVELAPKDLELTPDKVAEYLHEIGAEETAGRIWSAMPEPRRWRERYVKHAKTFVRFGSGSSASVPPAAGMSLEIVPEGDPTLLSVGGTLSLMLMNGGTPLADAKVGIVSPGAPDSFATTDATGRAKISLTRSGKWLLRFTHLRRCSIRDLEWESDFTTMSFEVLPSK